MVVKSLENPSTNNNWILPTDEEILTLPIEELLKRLKTSLNGLSSKDVEERLKLFGYNELVKKKKEISYY
ncbi:MAG: cation-transporting P-type ATPase [Candidatus Methanomethylicia archaeon]|nr:cation-transporting P-type ATPase [Candidatus Methanomethylicia archaeon]